ncbi:hypothetical protein Cgig2_007528 [Carnegiea gigantea]|uniref:BED-type domain-containing protein n=1 Tax=Carnegiea gigantea TaxID=171969 RepID=A0A9Q1GVP6_9CARY|nr:hypothetical protein Cgig2_007528 [Carnegiea gigantea]
MHTLTFSVNPPNHSSLSVTPIPTTTALDAVVEDDKKRSSLWLDFIVIDGNNFSDGKKGAQCSHCKKAAFIAVVRYGTSNMKKHLEKCKAYQATKASEEGGGEKREYTQSPTPRTPIASSTPSSNTGGAGLADWVSGKETTGGSSVAGSEQASVALDDGPLKELGPDAVGLAWSGSQMCRGSALEPCAGKSHGLDSCSC